MPSRQAARPNGFIRARFLKEKESRAAPDIRKPNAVLKRMGSKEGCNRRRVEFCRNHPAITASPRTDERKPAAITMYPDRFENFFDNTCRGRILDILIRQVHRFVSPTHQLRRINEFFRDFDSGIRNVRVQGRHFFEKRMNRSTWQAALGAPFSSLN